MKRRTTGRRRAARLRRRVGAWLRAFGGAMLDEWRFVGKQRVVLVILMALPLLYPTVISYLYYEDQATERPLVLVDEDNSGLSRRLTRALHATQGVEIIARETSPAAARQALQARQAEGAIIIPADFSTRLKQGSTAAVKLWLNTANMYTYSVSYTAVVAAATTLNGEIGARYFFSKGMPTSLASQRVFPINQDVRYLFHPTASYGNFLVPGILIIVLQQLMLIGLCFSVGLRRELGLEDAGDRRPFTSLLARFSAQGVFYLGAMLLMVFFDIPLFGWSVRNAGVLLLVFIGFSLAMAPLVMLTAHFCRDRYIAFQLLMFVSTPLFMVSGFVWPSSQMPGYIQALAKLAPATPALAALRTVTMKSPEIGAVAPDLLRLLVLTTAYFTLAVPLVRWTHFRRQRSLQPSLREF